MLKKLLWSVLCLSVFVCGAAAVQGADSGSNLIGNPSFEEPLKENGAISGWTNFFGVKATVKLDAKESYHGENSICLANTNETGMVLVESEKRIPVKPGEQYVLTGYVKADMDSLNPDDSKKTNKSAGFFIQGRTNAGGWGKTFDARPGVTTTTSAWIECSTDKITIPAEGTDKICVRLVINGGYMQAWFDNISLMKVK